MAPETTRKNREKLFFCYFMDCQTPKKPGGGADQTWEVAEQAVTGLAELFEERGISKALGFCSEPEVTNRQSDLFRETAAAGCWQALHFQVRGYRPSGATEDYSWERRLDQYDYEEQKEVLTVAKDDWEQAMGTSTDTFGACCAQCNDYTFPILDELGFRQCYCSCPGRYNPENGHFWWGAFPHSHHTSSKCKLVCGDLDLYEFPLTRGLVPTSADGGKTWSVEDLRAEKEMGFEEQMALCVASIDDMLRRDHPILYIHAPTHNTWDVGDRSSHRRRAVETTIDVAHACADRYRLQLVPASLRDMREEADRLNAY